jgi:hypothetical protein
VKKFVHQDQIRLQLEREKYGVTFSKVEPLDRNVLVNPGWSHDAQPGRRMLDPLSNGGWRRGVAGSPFNLPEQQRVDTA